MTRFILIFLFCLSLSGVFAQEEEIKHAKTKGYNPNYRVNYFDKMIFQVELNTNNDNFYIQNLSYSKNRNKSFVPNNFLRTKFSFDYKFLGLNFSISPNFLQSEKDPRKGETKILDLGFKFFYTDRLRQEVTFKTIKGFYLEDLDTFEPLEIFSELEIKTIGGKTFFVVNKNFSYRSFESMTERQIKSNGSIIPSISYYFNNLETNQNTGKNFNLKSIKSFDTYFQLGYMHNFILHKKWFATIGVHPGIGLNKSTNYFTNALNEDFTKTSSFNVNYNIDANIAIGYNNKDFFTGLKSTYRNYDYNNKNTTEIKTERTNFGIYFGYRFNETKTMKKAFEYIERKLKI